MVAQSEEAERSRGAGTPPVAVGGWAGIGEKCDVDNPVPFKRGAASRLERRLKMREGVAKRQQGVTPEMTASIRRKIQFLEDCDRWGVFSCQKNETPTNGCALFMFASWYAWFDSLMLL